MMYAVLCYNNEEMVCGWSKEQDDAVMTALSGVHEKWERVGKLKPSIRLLPTSAATTFSPLAAPAPRPPCVAADGPRRGGPTRTVAAVGSPHGDGRGSLTVEAGPDAGRRATDAAHLSESERLADDGAHEQQDGKAHQSSFNQGTIAQAGAWRRPEGDVEAEDGEAPEQR